MAMANKPVLDLKLLRSSAPRGQATHLRHVLNSNPAAASSITSQLISHVASDSLPSIVLSLWPSVVNEPQAFVAVIQQELCVSAQSSAIKQLYRHLRKRRTFAKAWEAAGGVTGIAQLAAKLNVDNVRFLFSMLGATGRAQGARKERQREMDELLKLLWGHDDDDDDDNDEHAAFDSRPLREAYVKLLPACGGALRLEWEEMKRQPPKRYDTAVATDHDFFENHYDEKLRCNEITASEFLNKVKPLVIHRTEYGLRILDRFIDSETLLGASPDALLDVVVDPLAKRFLSKQRVSSDTTMRFWSRVIQCLRDRQAFRKDFDKSSEHYKRIIARLVKVWNHSRARAEYTEMLTTLFSLVPETVVKGYSLADLIRAVAPALRYRLLRLFLKHTAGNQFDIGEPGSLEHSELDSASVRWHADIFFLLSADEAFLLWEKIQRAGKDVGFWGPRPWNVHFLYCNRDEDQDQLADRHIMRSLLLNQSQAVSPFTSADLDTMRSEIRQDVARRMKKATQGRFPEHRAQWAVSALSLCVATGDLKLYAETLRWARRFNKDPLTVKELYKGVCLATVEGIDLLTVLPTQGKRLAVPLDELAQRIHSANEILQIVYETVIMAKNEPSFNAWDWRDTFDFIHRVLYKRLSRANDFQDRTKISDEALYEALWQPTSAMLKKMVSDLLGPVGKGFESIGPYASLSELHVAKPETLREPTIKFLDHLAEFHDSIWRELRMRETPALVTADDIWPKGLTLQHLSAHFGEALPYLPHAQSRAEVIVFMNPLKILQPIQVDEETQLAIGTFVDGWSTALRLYIQMPGKELSREALRKERISKAWRRATVDLSKGRMSAEEAERYWWPVFQSAGVELREVGIDEKADERPEPSLPDIDEDMQPIEWNPDPEYDRISQPEKNKTIRPTCLDVLLSRPSHVYSFTLTKDQSSIFDEVKAVVPGKPRPSSYWDSFFTMKTELTGTSADAYATAAILALNMQLGSDTSLLKTPFPSIDTVRIPAVYLDQEFLEREADRNLSGSDNVVAELKSYVPAGLLVQLAASLLESIRKKPETHKPYGMFVLIIKIILKGADPSLAVPLIQEFVLENPDASSWHRPLLNPRVLMNLLPADAKRFFESFTEAILDKLQEQAERRASKESGDASASRGPLVKVTTVKMLAQLLRESPVVDPSLAVELNIRILKRASHVDIRTASVTGLTEAIGNTTNPVVQKRIFDALLKYAAPIASSINEAQPSTDWDALTPGSELPEIWKDADGNFTTPPITNLLLMMGYRTVWQSDKGRALQELIYSVLDASAENNRRWTSLFLQKHGFSMPDNAQLPAIPMFPTALDTLVKVMRSETSAKYVDLSMEYLLLKSNPPDWLSAISKAVRDDQKLASSNSGQHWIRLWDGDGDRFTRSFLVTICVFALAIDKKAQQDAPTKVFHHSLESFLFGIADALLMQAQTMRFDAFLSNTEILDRENPAWGQILDRINGLRTPAWQADPNRKPAVLPNTLQLKIRMLNLPRRGASNSDDTTATTARCANGVAELLKDIVSSGEPYFDSFTLLQNELEALDSKAEMAIMIGSTPALDKANATTLVDHLRVKLAVGMLTNCHIFRAGFGKPHEESVVQQAKQLVKRMSDSSVENFRTLAAPLKAIIENVSGWDIWD